MKELVEIIVKNIVDNPTNVEVTKVEGTRSIILEIDVAEEDMGKVIGRQGKVAKAIRTVVKAAAAKEGKRVIVEILQ
ncbi:MAG: KH domain-containing protein [Bacillota bacterium]